ncbi:MAG: hypothetical protein KBT57_09905 [bacterium]|nr:hypothetical protein [Candidatus Limimorpha equi]
MSLEKETAKGHSLSPLAQEIDKCKETLNQQRTLSLQNTVSDTLAAMVARVVCQKDEILETKAKSKPSRQPLVFIVAKGIVEAADGNLAVPSFSPKAKAEQKVFLFVGTHWIQLDSQQFFDFVNRAAERLGLSEEERMSASFMCAVYEQVAFIASRVRSNAVPQHEAWLNLQNGTLEVKADGSTVFRGHRRDDFFLYALPYCYDAAAGCPRWHRFLDEVLPDLDTQLLLAEYVGYCFTKDIKAEKMLVLYGSGSNGKSVALDVIETLLGSANVSNVSFAELTDNDEKRSLLEGKLANISHESGAQIDTARLKQIVSGEPVEVRRLYENTHIMRDYAKIIVSFNMLPRAEVTMGYFRRWMIVEFGCTITEEKADVDLAKKLCCELPGILNWVLTALTGFVRRRNFSPCMSSAKALEHYKRMSDSVRLFVDEMCCVDEQYSTPGKELYSAYSAYCHSDGLKPLGKQNFFERLQGLGVKRHDVNRTPFFNLKRNHDDTF